MLKMYIVNLFVNCKIYREYTTNINKIHTFFLSLLLIWIKRLLLAIQSQRWFVCKIGMIISAYKLRNILTVQPCPVSGIQDTLIQYYFNTNYFWRFNLMQSWFLFCFQKNLLVFLAFSKIYACLILRVTLPTSDFIQGNKIKSSFISSTF